MTRVRQVTDNADSIVDFLYALSPSQWKSLQDISQFSGFSDQISKTASEIQKMQTFGVLNIADQPLSYIKTGSLILIIAALAIPLLSWATQMLNLKLMPQAATQGNDDNNAMASSMKTMNTVMPLMSAVFCFTFPVGLGIYWIASAVVRSIQQLVINRLLDKMDINDLINENMKKLEKKRTKEGLPPQKITNQANQSTKNINTKIDKGSSNANAEERARKVEESYQKARNAKAGSITAKANMVRDFDERNKKK